MTLSRDHKTLLERIIRQDAPITKSRSSLAETERVEPTSYGQRRLWFMEQLQQNEVPYTLHAIQNLKFPMDPQLLERAVNEIVRRHEILRTSFHLQDDEPVQKIAAELTVPLRVMDLTAQPDQERQPETLRQMGMTIARKFDLEKGPMLRTEFYRLDEQEWLFLLTVHHIVFDGPSFQVFFNELEAIYGALVSNQPHRLPPLGIQYAGFARAQRKKLTPERVAEDVAFWRTELSGVPMLQLPVDRRRVGAPTFRGAHQQVSIAPGVVARLQQRATAAKTTLFNVMLAGFWATLSRVCDQVDFAIGLPVTGRTTAELQKSIGFYVDTVITRIRLEGKPSTEELIEITHSSVNRSLLHRSLPFEMLVQHLQPERNLGHNPYFQVGFQLMQYSTGFAELNGFNIVRSSTMFDLGLDLWMKGDGLGGCVQYNTDLFDPATIDFILKTYDTSLEWLIQPQARLDDLEFGVTEESDNASILHGECLDFPKRSCVAMIADFAKHQHDFPAIQSANEILSYGDLVDRMAQLSGALVRQGVEPGVFVALELKRSLDLVCLQLALLRCGAAFICVDPAWPRPRRDLVLSDARPKIVIDSAELENLKATTGPVPSMIEPQPDDVAYIIFTSGSTGQPKGVVIEHRGLVNLANAQLHIFELTPGRRVAQLASPTFDASVFETVLALCSGATLFVAPPDVLAGDDLAHFLNRYNIDTIVVPPTVLATVEPNACPAPRLICVAGESCPSDLAQRWSEGRTFWNLYGPTETTIWATYGNAPLGSKVSIGGPIPNLDTVVVDPLLRVVPTGVAGELCVAGEGLGRGYLNQPVLTTDRFIEAPPVLSNRLYRTGDLVRQTHSGDLVFMGRVDRQVKVRGCRIEPEEIEIVLRGHPQVTEVVVNAVHIEGGESELAAYIQCNGESSDVIQECRELIQQRLPQHMFVGRFLVVESFPRTASGKIDLNALPTPAPMLWPESSYVEPSTPTERRVAELMKVVTRATCVGASDDFFLIGGHSLAAAQLVARARTLFKADLTIRDIFAYPTVSSLAARIDELELHPGAEVDTDEAPLIRLPRGQRHV